MRTQTHDLTFTPSEVHKTYVSWDRGEADREWACLTLLAEHAPGIAPTPLRRDRRDGAPVVVMERLPGQPLGAAPLTRTQTESLGRVLRRMYAVPLEAIKGADVGERQGGPTRLAAEVQRWLGEPNDLADCREPTLIDEAVDAASRWLATSEALPDPELSALGIGDLNPANVLWDGATCRLVDFEDGGLTDPAFELADHVEHIAARLANVYDREALVEATGLSDAARLRHQAYRPLWASFWLLMLLPGNRGFQRNPRGSTEAQARHLLALLG